MQPTRSRRAIAATALVLGLGAGAARGADRPAPAPAPPAPPPPHAGWTFQATAYGWATGLTGDVGIRNFPPVRVDISFFDMVKDLKGAFMGSFLAKNDQWLILTDLVWADLSANAVVQPRGIRRPVLAEISPGTGVKLEQRQAIASGLIGYRLPSPSSDLELHATAGVRYQRLTTKVKVTPGLIPLTLSNETTIDWADPVFGVSLQYKISDRWFFNALADIGGFGVGSQLTAQGFAALGYKWTESISTAVGYRVIYTDYRSDKFNENLTQHGLFTSIAAHF